MKKLLYLNCILCLMLFSCTGKPKTKSNKPSASLKPNSATKIDLPQIKKRDTLVALTGFNSISYFIYRGQPMGYEYELLERFARHLDVELKLIIVRDMDDIFELLNSGKGDIIAHNLTVTGGRKEIVNFSDPVNTTQQVLVQRKPENWRQLKQHQIEKKLIRTPLELSGKTIHIREGSSYYPRLLSLMEETGEEIDIETVTGDEASTESLIKQVAHGEIDYTISDENIASISTAFFPNLDIDMAVSLQQQIAWATRKNAPKLLKEINAWLDKEQKNADYYVIYNKYFKSRRTIAKAVKSPLYAATTGKISMYDELIRKHSVKIDWDWRLVASLIYQESKFDPSAESWVGAKGLMQMMPETAADLKVEDLEDPDNSIKAGTDYLRRLERFWEKRVEDEEERIKFVLASYNAGPGHVLDAMRLAEKYGKNPQKWENHVADFLRKKSKPKYYNDPVVKSGFCRGEEPFKYVTQILRRYEHYKTFVKEESKPKEVLATK
ncbi:MltF family protein [Luteibaculum oceani]|nr:transporter substrate-binding domain-containing protein [Luteibaculum oceani]